MVILLDIDGVLVTNPPWKKPDFAADGFMLFNTNATKNLAALIAETNAAVILTSTHRVNYSPVQWLEIFESRGIILKNIFKLNEVTKMHQMSTRAEEIQEWADRKTGNENYVIIDDDKSINNLPVHIKNKCVLTDSLIGFDDAAKNKALAILLQITFD